MEYLTVKEAGAKCVLTGRILNYCSAGRIKDSVKPPLWLVPESAERPLDGRKTFSKRKGVVK